MNDENITAILAPKKPIGASEVMKATEILRKYKTEKENLATKIVENYEWYRLRQWECIRRRKKKEKNGGFAEPTSAWLFDAIINKHADAMDNMPMANILPREAMDVEEAERLSSIVPVILKQCGFQETYDSVTYDKLIAGTGAYGVFWDSGKLNGLGDINIVQIDPLNIFWEPGITNIQDSENVFTVELRSRRSIIDEFPDLGLTEADIEAGEDLKPQDYRYDSAVNTDGKAIVVSWYYKKRQNGKTVLHYVKYVGKTVLYASENDTFFETDDRYDGVTGDMHTVKLTEATAETGYYSDGKYPFIIDRCFPMKGSVAGFGYIDVEKSPQEFIDRTDAGIMSNVLFNAYPRYFVKNDTSINEKEFLDTEKMFVHIEGSNLSDNVMPLVQNPLPGNYITSLEMKINELKETSGNRDVATGGTTGGVTAASGIAAMQEASGKKSRDFNQASFRRFEELVYMVIERIRQFYSLPRQFRIIGKDGEEQYISYSNEKLKLQPQGQGNNEEMLMRKPEFDIEVSAQKRNAYTKLSQNELALQLYSAGFFNPNNADQAIACLEMMDFDRKNIVLKKVRENQTLLQRVQQLQALCLQMAQELDGIRKTNLAPELFREFTGQPLTGATREADEPIELSGGEQEGTRMKNARERSAMAASPG